MVSLEKYGLQTQIQDYFNSRPKTQSRKIPVKKSVSPKFEPQIIMRDYHYDNRAVFDKFTTDRGRNQGLAQILTKMHLGRTNNYTAMRSTFSS